MTLTPAISAKPETCWRCTTLGLPPGGIPADEPHLIAQHDGITERVCIDCFNRLADEPSELEE